MVRGAWAELTLVDGSPLTDVDIVGSPGKNQVMIMKNGTITKILIQQSNV